MNSFSVLPGLYGKIPTLGDFVNRRLTTDFIETWDKWLQNSLSASKEQLGSEWTGIYLRSPIWHFILSKGICDSTPWAGILMPSVDKVGRYFPLTFAMPIHHDNKLADIFFHADDWFEKMEQLALSVLENDLDITMIDRNLQALNLPDASVMRSVEIPLLNNTDDNSLYYLSLDTPDQVKDSFAYFGFNTLTNASPLFTIWRTTGSTTMGPCLRVYHSLPPMDDFSKFLYAHETACTETEIAKPACLSSTDDIIYETILCQDSSIDNTIEAQDYQWSSFAFTTIGKRKNINEDAYLERSEIGLWAVADGTTIQPAGDISSNIVIHVLESLMATGNLESYSAYTIECLHSVNTDLFKAATRQGDNRLTGTSIVVMLAVGKQCAVIWVGSCCLYQLRDSQLTQMTMDHPQPFMNSDINKKDNTKGDLLGVSPEILFEMKTFEARVGDVYLLCSDGLSNKVNHQEIEDILQKGTCRTNTQQLMELVMKRDAIDNVTVVVSRLR